MATTHEKTAALQRRMQEAGIDALVVPGSDPHGSEYPADCWRFRQWLSGFTGSAGRVVVTTGDAALETDSRYFLQAEHQLAGSPFGVIRAGEAGGESLYSWLAERLAPGATIAADPELLSTREARELIEFCETRNYRAEFGFTPLYDLWEERPPVPERPISVYPESYSGEAAGSKAKRLLQKLREAGTDGIFITALDEIAWLFNLRGSDVRYNPVAVAYAFLSERKRILFTDVTKLPSETLEYLRAQEIAVQPYGAIWETARNEADSGRLLVDPDRTNYRLFEVLTRTAPNRTAPSPIPLLKSRRNEREIESLKGCMIKDGAALVRFLIWLERAVPQGGVSESTVGEKLRELRSRQPLYIGESFGTIAGYGPHGAVVHYEATPESDARLRPEGFLLVDSGAQYLDGTTDITRTIALGEPSAVEKRHFTLVLKGHIALASCRFPTGTRGAQLDVLARQFLWNDGLLYLHGTGHGVGHFLNVHEGPQNIRLEENPTPLLPGMVTSNEPGLYLEGRYGIRTENLILTVADEETEFGSFCRFETLTLCPIDRKAIDTALLSDAERSWLDRYHRRVCRELAPLLDADEQTWLKTATRPL